MSQKKHYYQTNFPKETFNTRLAKVFKEIGNKTISLVQRASGVDGFDVFRQSNSFYYLCGLETPHAYLLLDGHNKKTTLSTERYRTCNEEERADSISPGKVVAP